jgi:hypothetical protein
MHDPDRESDDHEQMPAMRGDVRLAGRLNASSMVGRKIQVKPWHFDRDFV